MCELNIFTIYIIYINFFLRFFFSWEILFAILSRIKNSRRINTSQKSRHVTYKVQESELDTDICMNSSSTNSDFLLSYRSVASFYIQIVLNSIRKNVTEYFICCT